jgi:PHD/YefM family antitoxin component YafN of YafNO toxin-antitoxin module
MNMKFFSVRDLRTSPKTIWQTLADHSEVVITNNGKPTALMIPVDENSLEDKLIAVKQAEAIRAVIRMQRASVASGVSGMNLDDINAEINAVRQKDQH